MPPRYNFVRLAAGSDAPGQFILIIFVGWVAFSAGRGCVI